MESTSYYEHNKIMGWDYTNKRLKELRWMRNQYTHEGVEESDEQIREAWKTVKICGYVLAIIVTGVLLGVIVANL